MKFISEFRDPHVVEAYLAELHKTVAHPWTIMEVCGGQTHSLVKNGILNLLPKQITMVHGPGCPVCVTTLHLSEEMIVFYALGWFSVFGLLALWSLSVLALHSVAVWSVSNASALTGVASDVEGLGLPQWLQPWVPPEITQAMTSLLADFAPVVESL